MDAIQAHSLTTSPSRPATLALFEGHRYLALETRRRSGATVVTPMCFVIHEDKIYLRTSLTSGKIKRLRHTPQVRLAPSDPVGKPLGNWVEGEVTLFGVGEMAWVYDLFKRKYRLEQRLVDLVVRWRRLTYVVLAVHL